MIYNVPAPDEPLSQAVVLDACPIFGLETAGGVNLDIEPRRPAVPSSRVENAHPPT